MGASGWSYTTPYVDDPATSLRLLREQTFAAYDFSDVEEWGCPVPASLDDLYDQVYGEYLGTEGTHSILDVDTFLAEDAAPNIRFGDHGVLRLWPKAKVTEVFGTGEPTGADVEAFDFLELSAADPSLTKWNGRCIVLYRDGHPHELFIWGRSGD
ncbi:hypothetical protein [Yinghuangia soli]|uniref:Uncharacterized protein n=1 Tax=Yinghuangia soli TaxID=2908204 RepID=A0AA41Q3U3_9ACTN|nr:hypothetical protein [Yinghuangia soli]MCF2530722.1 hypothetical protein [Yinghuangia soli]